MLFDAFLEHAVPLLLVEVDHITLGFLLEIRQQFLLHLGNVTDYKLG